MNTLYKTQYFGVNDLSDIDFVFDEVITDQREEFHEILQSNIEIIYKDIVERMEYEKLQPDVRVDFDNIRHQHITRQGQTAMRMILQEVLEDTLKGNHQNIDNQDSFVNKALSGKLVTKYNYGNYIYFLQQYSYFNIKKELVHMLLAMQTANMTNLYNNILLSPVNEKEEFFSDLRQIINGSISGVWFNDMLCFAGGITLEKINKVKNKLKGFEKDEITFKIKEDEDKEEIMTNIIRVLCCLMNGDQEFLIQKDQESITLKNINFSRIDPFGFVMWYFDQNKREEIIESFKSRNKEWSTQFDNIKKEDYSKCALPIYSLDVYYNLLKRLYEDKEINFEECENNIILYKDDEVKQISYEIINAEKKCIEEKEKRDAVKDSLEKEKIIKEAKEQELKETEKMTTDKTKESEEIEKAIADKKKELEEIEKVIADKKKKLNNAEEKVKDDDIYETGTKEIHNVYTKLGQAYCQLLYRIKCLLKKQDSYYNEPYNYHLLHLEKNFLDCPFVNEMIHQPEDANVQCVIHLITGFLLYNLETPSPLV